MSDWIGKVIEELRSPRLLVAGFCVCLILLLLPTDTLKSFGPGVAEGMAQFRFPIFIGMLFLGVLILWDIGKHISVMQQYAAERRHAFDGLSRAEKEVLAGHLKDDRSDAHCVGRFSTSEALVNRGLMVRSEKLGGHGCDYIIEPWAWEYLKKRPEIVAPPS